MLSEFGTLPPARYPVTSHPVNPIRLNGDCHRSLPRKGKEASTNISRITKLFLILPFVGTGPAKIISGSRLLATKAILSSTQHALNMLERTHPSTRTHTG
jgi:hypothetical protein